MFRTNAYQESNYPDVTILDNSHKDGMRGRKLRYINGGILRGIKFVGRCRPPGRSDSLACRTSALAFLDRG